MDSSFLEFCKKFKVFNLKDIHALYKISKIKSYKSGEVIATEGEVFQYGLIIMKGIIRTFLLQHDGVEKTVRLTFEGGATGCANCVLKNEPSFEYLQAIEDCKVIQINTLELKRLADENHRIQKLWCENLASTLYEAVHRIQFFVVLSPEERYRQLLKESPKFIHRVPQKYLASYIGVTTVSLSRIRARI